MRNTYEMRQIGSRQYSDTIHLILIKRIYPVPHPEGLCYGRLMLQAGENNQQTDQLLRQLRHDLRGRANTMLLCVSALPLALDENERLEFVDEISIAADKLLVVLDQLEEHPSHFAS